MASEPHCKGIHKATPPIGCFTFLRKPKPLSDLSVCHPSQPACPPHPRRLHFKPDLQ